MLATAFAELLRPLPDFQITFGRLCLRVNGAVAAVSFGKGFGVECSPTRIAGRIHARHDILALRSALLKLTTRGRTAAYRCASCT